MEGVLNVLKPPGMTSHDVVDVIREKTGLRKVGHAGTLDPLAAGVLVVFVGRATRIIQFMPDDKQYRVELVLGVSTATGDAQGEITGVRPVDRLDDERLRAVLDGLTGPVTQVPPMTSARKIGGKKLYEYARRGVEVPREPRPVKIYRLRLVAVRRENAAHPRLVLDVACSKGTYIRTLCTEIGDRLGCGAFMSFLVRTAVGSFGITTARTLEEISALAAESRWSEVLVPIDMALQHLPVVKVKSGAVKAVLSGRPLYPPGVADLPAPDRSLELVRLSDGKHLLAVARLAEGAQGAKVFKPVWVRSEHRELG